MGTNYTFSVNLFDASANSSELQVWQSGTLLLSTSSSAPVEGVLTIPGYYPEPIPFSGTTLPPGTVAGATVVASGKSAEAEITFTITYNCDGFLYIGSYLGGLLSVLDYNAEETYLYALQGLSPQCLVGATVRGSLGAADKRKPQGA